MTAIDFRAVDRSLVSVLASATGRPVGYCEAPSGTWNHPTVIVYPMSGPPMEGSMANPQDMGDFTYQITVTGETADQALECQGRVFSAIDSNWKSITGCCGVVGLSRQGTMRIEDRLYQAVLLLTLKESV